MVRPLGCCLFVLIGLVTIIQCRLPELECPEECDCHYFRVNWVIDCSDSNLTAVPTQEEGLSLSVYELNMNGNNLTVLEPFPEDIKLRSLKMADNRLMKVTKEEFSGLGYLLDVDLSGNSIAYIEPDSFSDSPGLITLELQMNSFEPVSGPFLISKSLLNLDISDCSLRNLNSVFFTDSPHLYNLDLSGNPLQVLTPGVFNPLTSLHTLKLNRCNLTSIHGETFSTLQDLKHLELSGNNLYNSMDWAAVLTPVARLEYLDISRSNIKTLPDDIFEHNKWLRSLIMSNNELEDLDVATTLGQNLKELDFLDISYCNISGPLSELAFANATKLRTLILSGNQMSAADLAVALSPLSILLKLSLRDCSLTRLPPNTFHKFPNLQELDISRNPLNDAFTSLLNPLKNLLHLDIGYSNLGSVSKSTFHKMTSLKTLILSGNPLQSLESGLFQNLTDLETLELNNCGLSRLNTTVFHESFSYPDLKELRLSGNPLEIPKKGSFLPNQLNRLKILDLSKCNISYLSPTAFHSFVNITALYLSGNKFTYTTDDDLIFLNNLPELEKLDLSWNNLTIISPSVFRFNEHLSWLKLVGNPWSCGCHIADMWEWAQSKRGDLSVLVGSTVSTEEMVRSSPRKRNILLCHFDSRKSPIKQPVTLRRQKYLSGNVNRTWPRYVRESDCESSRRLSLARLSEIETTTVPPVTSPPAIPPAPMALLSGETIPLASPVVSWHAAAFLSVTVVAASVVLIVLFNSNKRRISRRNRALSPTSQDHENTQNNQ